MPERKTKKRKEKEGRELERKKYGEKDADDHEKGELRMKESSERGCFDFWEVINGVAEPLG